MARASEKRTRKIATARRAVETRKRGGSGPIKLPKGLKWFDSKDREDFTVNVMPFTVSKASKDFHPDVVFADVGELYYEQTYWAHFGIGANEGKVICAAKQFGKKCPICEYRAEMIQDPKHEKKEADALKPKQRQLWVLQDLDKPKDGLQVWDQSYHTFGVNIEEKIKKARPEKREKYEAFHDPDAGFSMRITAKEKKTDFGKFNEFLIDEMIEREEALSEKLLDSVPCLCDLIECPNYKEVKDLFMQTGEDEDEDDEDEDDEPKKDKKKPKKDEEEDDDDEEEDEEEDEDDEEEADEEEDDDEDDGDEGEGEEVELEKGSVVAFKHKKKYVRGIIAKIDKKKDIADVKVDGEKKTIQVALDDLTLIEEEDDDSDDDDDEEDEKPKRGKGKKSKKEEEDDDDDGDEEDDEEEEDSFEEEEDEEDDEEEDEPKKPAKKKATKK